MKRKLLVIISDRLSDLINKGEITPRYYNPGNLFDEVHIMMINDDIPDVKLVQCMVGNARLHIHNYPYISFRKTLGWQTWFMKNWLSGAIEIVKKINPHLIRCHGANLNSFIAAHSKKLLNIPYLVSLHINPDENFRKYSASLKEKIIFTFLKKIEKTSLKNANLVMPVYQPIIPYLGSMKIKNYEVCYNSVNSNYSEKKLYKLSNPIRILTIGRLIKEKNPINIIKAIKDIPNIHLTIIGQGPIKDNLVNYTQAMNLTNEIKFIDTVDNTTLCNEMKDYDILAIHSEYYEFSKVVIEASLVGLPILINYRKDKKQVPELQNNNCFQVKNSVDDYHLGLEKLINNQEYRMHIAKNAREFALNRCNPSSCESKYVAIYKKYMKAITI